MRFAGGINGNKVAASLKAKLSEPISAAKFISLFDLEGFGEKKLDKIEEILKSMLDGAEPTVKEIIEVDGWAIQSALDFLEAFKANKQDIMQCKDFFDIGSAVVTHMCYTDGDVNTRGSCWEG